MPSKPRLSDIRAQKRLQQIERRCERNCGRWVGEALKVQRAFRGMLGRRIARRLKEDRIHKLQATVHTTEAERLVSAGEDDDTVLAKLEMAIQADATYMPALALRAKLCYSVGEWKLGLEYAAKSIQGGLSGESAIAAHLTRAMCHGKNETWCEGIEDLSFVLRYRDQDDEVYKMRGLFYVQIHDYSSAVFDFAQALEYKPRPHADDFIRLAMAQSCNKDYLSAEKAIADALQVADSEIVQAKLLIFLARTQACLRNFEAAAVSCRSALKEFDYPPAEECLEEVSDVANLYPMLTQKEIEQAVPDPAPCVT